MTAADAGDDIKPAADPAPQDRRDPRWRWDGHYLVYAGARHKRSGRAERPEPEPLPPGTERYGVKPVTIHSLNTYKDPDGE